MNFSYQASGWKIGDIRLWYNDNIPPGWVICDGLNGTPKTTGRVVVGASNNEGERAGASGEIPKRGELLGNTTVAPSGKAEKHTLSVSEMPSHGHSIPISNGGSNGPSVFDRVRVAHVKYTSTSGQGSSAAHEHSLTLNAIDVRQKSVGVYYIMKVR